MSHRRLVSLLLLCVLLAGPAFAGVPPSAVMQLPPNLAPVVTSPLNHDTGHAGPIVVNWQFLKGQGLAHLIVNPDGSSLYSGHYKGKRFVGSLQVTIALKSPLAGVYLFRYTGNADIPLFEWSKEGKSTILKDDFKSFAGPHDWVGQYVASFPISPRARKAEHAEGPCTPQDRKSLGVVIGPRDACTRWDTY